MIGFKEIIIAIISFMLGGWITYLIYRYRISYYTGALRVSINSLEDGIDSFKIQAFDFLYQIDHKDEYPIIKDLEEWIE